jgi:hypothetical protein
MLQGKTMYNEACLALVFEYLETNKSQKITPSREDQRKSFDVTVTLTMRIAVVPVQ